MARRTRLITLIALAGFVGSVSTMGLSGPGLAAPRASSEVTYSGIDPPRSLSGQPTAIQALMDAAGDLAEENQADFLGVYLNAQNQVAIVASTARGETLARTKAPGTAVERSSLSIASVRTEGARIAATQDSFKSSIVFWAAHPEGASIVVGMRRQPTDEERAAFSAFAASERLPIHVEVIPQLAALTPVDNRSIDGDPYSGGARTASSSSSSGSDSKNLTRACTTGVSYWRNDQKYLLTAGHCYPTDSNADYMWSVTGASPHYSKVEYMGHSTFSTWSEAVGALKVGSDNARHGDLALVNVTGAGHKLLPSIWWGTYSTGDRIRVTQRHAPKVGEPLCFSGYVSGSDCGLQVYATNLSGQSNSNGDRLDGEDLYYSSKAADCPVQGDSGSPIIYNHEGAETDASLRGIVSQAGESDGKCVASGTGIEEMVQAWGGDLLY